MSLTATNMNKDAIDVSATVTPGQPQGQNMALERRPEVQAVGLFGTNEPAAVVAKATTVANALKDVIVKQGLVSKISGKEYPRCEAWTLLGTMLGVFPVTVWTKQTEDGWEARVEARTKDGAIIGAAEAECLRSERNWANRDDFALRSMAQTRATAKCLRMPLGFVMTLAGFEATPAEEMVTDHPHKPANRPQAKPQGAPPKTESVPKTPPPPADEQTRARMIRSLSDFDEELLLEYFRALHDPAVLLDTESLAEIPLQFVPVTTGQFKALKEAITDFANGAEVRHAFPPNRNSAQPTKPIPTQNIHPLPKDQPGQVVSAVDKSCPPPAKPKPHLEKAKQDPDWFWNVVITVPRKGEKKAEYDKHPDTIGSLYQAIQDGDGEAGRRLWGLAKNWECAPREFKGKIYQPTDADKVCREALDEFVEYEEANGGGEDELPM